MTALVLDTHAAVWHLQAPDRLSPGAAAAIDEATKAGDVLYVPSIALVELVYLGEKGRLPEEALDRLIGLLQDDESNLKLLPLGLDVVRALKRVSRDEVPDMPDRIIAASAVARGLPLLSRDRRISASNAEVIW
jgi:PIN domain nuclease of toxin-antitoxin system